MSYKKGYEIRDSHPGWAVRFTDGTWLGGAHGYIRTGSAEDAYIYSSKEEGQKVLDYLKTSRTESSYFSFPSEIVEAWQPICEMLRSDVAALKQANVVEYLDIFDLRSELEAIVGKVKNWEEKGKKIQLNVNWEGLANFLGCSVDEVSSKLLSLYPQYKPNTNGDKS
jgi:hypothetical protein